MSGKIKQYRYDADYNESYQKWFGYVNNTAGKRLYISDFVDTYQQAIVTAEKWIAGRLHGKKNEAQ